LIKAHYEIDTVIFAICCNDLDCGLAICHADWKQKIILFNKFNGSVDTTDEFEKNHQTKDCSSFGNYPGDQIEKIYQYVKNNRATMLDAIEIIDFDLYGARAVKNLLLPLATLFES
jgi:hypothetical protein